MLLTDRYNRLALSWWSKGAERQLPDHVLEVLEALCEAQWGQVPSSENRVFYVRAVARSAGSTRTCRHFRYWQIVLQKSAGWVRSAMFVLPRTAFLSLPCHVNAVGESMLRAS